MAGKVKKKDDGVQSKTARASMRTGPGNREAYNPAPDVSRILPLGAGTHAYVLDPRDGRTLHLEVASDRFVEALGVLCHAGHGELVRKELAFLADRFPAGDWKDALARLEQSLAGGDEAA